MIIDHQFEKADGVDPIEVVHSDDMGEMDITSGEKELSSHYTFSIPTSHGDLCLTCSEDDVVEMIHTLSKGLVDDD